MNDSKTFKKICRDFFPNCRFHEWGAPFKCICCYKSGRFVTGHGLPKGTVCCFAYGEDYESHFYYYKNANGSPGADNYKTTPYNLKRILNNAKKAGV